MNPFTSSFVPLSLSALSCSRAGGHRVIRIVFAPQAAHRAPDRTGAHFNLAGICPAGVSLCLWRGRAPATVYPYTLVHEGCRDRYGAVQWPGYWIMFGLSRRRCATHWESNGGITARVLEDISFSHRRAVSIVRKPFTPNVRDACWPLVSPQPLYRTGDSFIRIRSARRSGGASEKSFARSIRALNSASLRKVPAGSQFLV